MCLFPPKQTSNPRQLLETRVSNYTTTAKQSIGVPAEAELQKLTARWTDLKDQVRDARKTIDLTVEYFKLSDKVCVI